MTEFRIAFRNRQIFVEAIELTFSVNLRQLVASQPRRPTLTETKSDFDVGHCPTFSRASTPD
jgi:hypothetical protein